MNKPWCWTWILAGFLCASAAAEDRVVLQSYGDGVLAFFSGRIQESFDHLDLAATRNPDDPRVFYFRGLAHLKLGNDQLAEKDFLHAAYLEFGASQGLYSVNRALERVQGAPRLQIEAIRLKGKAASIKRVEAAREARREQIFRNEPKVLEKVQPGVVGPADPLKEPLAPTPDPVPAPKTTEPPAPAEPAKAPSE